MDMCFGFLANTIYFRSWAILFARSLTSPPASPPILPEKRARLRNVYLNVFPRLLEKKCLTCKCLTRQRCSSWRRFLTQVDISDFEFECHIKGLFPNFSQCQQHLMMNWYSAILSQNNIKTERALSTSVLCQTKGKVESNKGERDQGEGEKKEREGDGRGLVSHWKSSDYSF